MDEKQAREILGTWIKPDGGLYDGLQYLSYIPGDLDAMLDARFTADELEAIAWWMRYTAGAAREP